MLLCSIFSQIQITSLKIIKNLSTQKQQVIFQSIENVQLIIPNFDKQEEFLKH